MSGKFSTLPPETLLAAIQASLAEACQHPSGEAAPAAILWTDEDSQWQALVSALRTLLPQFLVWGPYAPAQRQGPAIWLRCVIERTLPEPLMPAGVIPIIYLPGVSRQKLRDAENCPDELKPLVELQYRGTVWSQKNGRDWTVEAFLTSDDTDLRLDVAMDRRTRDAMTGALSNLANVPLARLRGRRLEAESFDKLMIEDAPKNLLDWLNNPQRMRDLWEGAKWAAFCSRCKDEYGFDPDSSAGELQAGEKLGLREGAWRSVWARYEEAPVLYPALPALLKKAKPAGLGMFDPKDAWPDENKTAESDLRKDLLRLAGVPAADARIKVAELEAAHGPRRKWIWSKLKQCPLANALEHLASLAKHTSSGLGGDTPAAMMDLYAEGGYRADDAVLRALAEAKTAEDFEAVSVAATAVYLPWLRDAAEHFQKLVSQLPLPPRGGPGDVLVTATAGTCIIFVDGLRFDLGQRLAGMAQDRKLRVASGRRWAALPTVTATAKPAVTPAAAQIVGKTVGETFTPEVAATGQPAVLEQIRGMLKDAGYQWLSPQENGNLFIADAKGWTEYGEFDKRGHAHEAGLAGQVEEQLQLLITRIEGLLKAGWKQVRVVTDHGWLLVPGGLPKVELPRYLTENRASRCAAIKPRAHPAVPTAPWYWNATESFAYSPGVSCFGKGHQYAHGGLSLQECVIPDLVISSDEPAASANVNIASVQWLNMRCRVVVEPAGVTVKVDIRTKVGAAASSVAEPKPVDGEGKVGMLVEDEALIGTAASVVLLDAAGKVVAKLATIIGGEK